ncbi:MAG TPA: stage IV sporulation protein A [Candidatus Enterocloster excrementigallinarum]|uniref:Stage IV sporulation protein A n=1 Tax=Candidatus Enterocloster excrementigallinarum TaxID=2838558 RepID=A0A9D2TD59_9FIRM|nr:stage IV sporulation protein A [Candidatus Enterocloster excrementigallinarum]
MDNFNVYKDIQARTGGEIYIGVVGPVRTGKSTFIKRFMELLVLPAMEDEHMRSLSRDELPQSAAGKTIMTTEPKFIPKEAARITLTDGIEAKVRLIDCVGFMAEGAAGHIENGEERLVKTPWFDQEIPFTQAAEIGTRKVIGVHSTIGIVVTADGSFGEIKRQGYIGAENRTIEELKNLGKPFVVLLNSARPYSDETARLAKEMSSNYGVSVLPVNCEQLKKDDIYHILEKVLKEFPVTQLDFHIPKWLEILPATHWLKAQVIQGAKNLLKEVNHMKDVAAKLEEQKADGIRSMNIRQMRMSDGRVSIQVEMDDGYYYQILSDLTGIPIEGEYQLLRTLGTLAAMQKEYEQVKNALSQVRMKGYGVVMPERSEIVLDEPQVIKHGNKYGVKMKAEAPSINMIKAHIETEIAPIVGSEQQAMDLIAYIKENARDNEDGVWNTNIFGKSIEQIVEDGIQAKISQMTEDCQMKLQDTLQKIINDSNGGMICIII